jgi:IPT/TIG domain
MEENTLVRKGLIYLTTTLMILLLVSLAMAFVPPAPANQNLGLYDTVFTGFTTEECKNIECHGDENLPNRHHLLIANEGYNCLDCHALTNGAFEAFRNCSDCHSISPHHLTDDAQNFNCSECHGSFVDDYNDGHVIPTYAKTIITPDSSYKYIDDSGVKIGGCEACHEQDLTADPQIGSNSNTHHNLSGFTTYNCNLCHSADSASGTPGEGGAVLDIRYCERCHGIKSLHSIQYENDDISGELGYGHIGNSWDCWGCHGFQESNALSSLDDSVGSSSEGGYPGEATVPSVDEVIPNEITVGQDTVITIYGTSFENEYNGTIYTSNVTLDNGTVTIELEPDSITSTAIEVTIPRTLVPYVYDLRVVKDGDMSSNKVTLTVIPDVQIEMVTIPG